MSYVLRSDEFVDKSKNWGHRNDISNLDNIIDKFQKNKINKHIS